MHIQKLYFNMKAVPLWYLSVPPSLSFCGAKIHYSTTQASSKLVHIQDAKLVSLMFSFMSIFIFLYLLNTHTQCDMAIHQYHIPT